MAANFPGMQPIGGYGPPPPTKPTPIIEGPSKVYLPHQGPSVIAAAQGKDSFVQNLPELKTKIFTNAKSAQDFLGYPTPRGGGVKSDIIGASILEVKMNWLKEGRRKVIYRPHDESIWQGFSVGNHEFYQVSNFQHEDIAKLITNSDDEVFIQRAPYDRTNLVKHVTDQIPKMVKLEKRYDKVRIPNVKLDRIFHNEDPINQLSFDINGVESKVEETINRVKVDMDFRGVEVKSVFYCNIGCYCEVVPDAPIEFKIDQPFLMWIHRKGMELPYFVGYITEQDWEEIDW